MKHSVESLKRNFTLAELCELEKELQERLKIENENWKVANSATYPCIEALVFANGRRKLLAELLGESNKKE